ncbi:MAG: glycosyltransferase family 4 protein, partial [Desulfovibrio sp.]|nr:glycosyltransferase family 4 protein [Desulfovibrio sp.]
MTASSSPTPLPERLPHIAVILLWYPLFTQPFIFRDVESLRSRLPVSVITLYGRNLRHCSEEMKEAARDVHTMGTAALPTILSSFFITLCRHPLRLLHAAGKSLLYRWKSLETFGENLWAFLCGVHLARTLKEAGIDICYAPWPRGTTTAARTVYLLEGIPFATSARGDNLNPADPDLVDKLNDALFIRTNNAADARRITGLAPACADRLRLVYNSLSLEVDSTAQVPMQPPVRLLAVGRFDITKGFDILLKACGILKERGRSFRLTLAGGGGTALGLGHMTQTILDLRKQLGLEKLVDLPGIVSHDQLPDLIRSHDIFLAPCVIHESGRRDGIPNTVIEAMSFGLPVIATNINAMPEIVRDGETGLLIPQKDPVALAGAICRLMDNPEEA